MDRKHDIIGPILRLNGAWWGLVVGSGRKVTGILPILDKVQLVTIMPEKIIIKNMTL